MSTSPMRKHGKPTLTALPLPDVPGAPLDLSGFSMPPLTPLAALQTSGNLTPGSLPLLVQMPDGQRKQVELHPSASVNDLRASLGAPDDWILNFNSETLDNTKLLSNYNITDAYDHAGGLLKMIDSSDLPPNQKLDALEKAVSVIQGISRGERDLERIIGVALSTPGSRHDRSYAFGKGSGDGVTPSTSTYYPPDARTEQGTSQNPRNGQVSRDNATGVVLDGVSPPDQAGKSGSTPIPQAPPTPSELIRRLGVSRPDLYPAKAAERMMADIAKYINPGSAHNRTQQDFPVRIGAGMQVAASVDAENEESIPRNPGNVSDADVTPKLPSELGSELGSAILRRGNTWFEDVMKSLVHSDVKKEPSTNEANQDDENDDDDDDDDDGDGDHGGSDQSDEDDSGNSPTSHGNPGQDDVDDRSPDGGEGEHYKDDDNPAASSSKPSGTVKVPKKRGRKRKNPELSEEERKALRQAQNRESAKQSRLRRKTIAAEYEKRVNTLSTENESLRDTISSLSDRLQFLQGLLTVSVTQRPGAGIGAVPPPGVPMQFPMVPGAGLPIVNPATAAALAASASAAASAAMGSYIGRPPPPL